MHRDLWYISLLELEELSVYINHTLTSYSWLDYIHDHDIVC